MSPCILPLRIPPKRDDATKRKIDQRIARALILIRAYRVTQAIRKFASFKFFSGFLVISSDFRSTNACRIGKIARAEWHRDNFLSDEEAALSHKK